MADLYQVITERFDRSDKEFDGLTEKMRDKNQRFAGLQYEARQTRLATEADVEPDIKTRKRTEDDAADPVVFESNYISESPCICEKDITTRGCSGGNSSDDTRFTELGRDISKELSRDKLIVFVLLWASAPKRTTGNLSSMHVPGIPS